MSIRSSIARAASAAMPLVAVLAIGACHETNHVLNPDWNAIPPGPSPVVEETRPATGIDEVVLDGVGRVYVRQGGSESLRIRTEQHILPFIRTEMSGGRLVLGFDEGTSYQGQAASIEFHVTVLDLERAELSGVGLISVSSLDADRLALVHTGVGTIEVHGLAATRLDATRSGVGEINVSGAVQQQSVVLGGVGAYEARNLSSAQAEVTIAAAGSATVRVSDRLDARIDGAGSVYYFGNPVVQRTGHGSGSVVPMGQ